LEKVWKKVKGKALQKEKSVPKRLKQSLKIEKMSNTRLQIGFSSSLERKTSDAR